MNIRLSSNCRRIDIAQNPGALYFGMGMFVLFGLLFSGIGVGTWMKAESTKKWWSVDGKVVSSDVDSHYSSKNGTSYSAAVTYDYEYHGKLYKGSKIAIMSSSSSDRGAAQRTADRYAAGSSVQVYVNPADPYEAVLQPGGSGIALVFVLFGGVFAAIGVAGFVKAPNLIAQAREKVQSCGQFNEQPSSSQNIPGAGRQDDPLGRL